MTSPEMTATETLAKVYGVAERAIEKGDANLAVYALRDLPETKELGLDDLAWEMYRNYCTKSEAADLLNQVRAAYPA